MRKLLAFLLVAGILLCLTACGQTDDATAPQVALTDVAAEAVPADELAPADVNEVAVATEEIILAQPMEAPMPQPASADPSAEPAAEADAPEEDPPEEE